ncbi:MAG: M56 family metallopeptidase [Acidobacteria bacterium]|nr:M56 family metallopeptidase [Acidobacteriota bacterium]
MAELNTLTNGLLGSLQIPLDWAIKSTVLLLLAWALTASLLRISAAIRHWIWSAAVMGLLALPFLSFLLPGWRLGLLPSPTPRIETALDANRNAPTPSILVTPISSTASENISQYTRITPSETIRTFRFEIEPDGGGSTLSAKPAWQTNLSSFLGAVNWQMAALGFWIFGALLVIARLLAGTFRVQRLANQAKPVTESQWISTITDLAAKLGIRGKVGLLRSEQIEMPMTIGALRSSVMLPFEANAWSQQCRNVVLLHELAHVKRRDCLTQNLAQLACAMYWFNPLVWLAAKRLRVERELACDDRVLEAGTKATDYAQHLVEIAKSFGAGEPGNARSMQHYSPVAVGLACSQLENRVRCILNPAVKRCGLNRSGLLLANIGAFCLVLSLAVVQPWKAAADSPLTPTKSQINRDSVISTEPQTAKTQPAEIELAKEQVKAAAEPAKTPTSNDLGDPKPENSFSAEQDQTKAQSSDLTVDQIVQLKSQNVTPEFIASMRKAGLDNLTVHELTNLRIHGVTEEFIQQAKTWNGGQISVNELVQLKVSGVTPDYIATMKRAGFGDQKLSKLSAMKLHGVTPEFIESMRKSGYENLTAEKLLGLKVHGIDEMYVSEIQRWIGRKPSLEELMQIKIHGVTPEYAKALKSLGYDNISIGLLTQMKIHDVSEQYIKEMADLGFKNLSVEQLVQMRIHDVTADYVKKLRAAGLKNISVNQMIQMKIQGIDTILLKGQR